MLVATIFLNLLVALTISSGEASLDGKSRATQHVSPDGEDDFEDDHLAFLGTQKEVEVYNKLPLEESMKKLEKISKSLDKDDNGFIDKKELSNWLDKTEKMLHQELAMEDFKSKDLDHNGFVDWNELTSEERIENFTDGVSVYEERTDRDKKIFDAADADKDGKLDIIEFQIFSNPEDYMDKMATVVLRRLHKHCDANNDGKVDLQEYLESRGERDEEEWLKQEKNMFQSTMDKNGDGTLDEQEIRGLLELEADEYATEKADHLISASDANKDGKLSMKEILDHHYVFVGHKKKRYEDEL